MSVIDDYLSNVEEPQREELERIRCIANETIPNSEEVISYGMPTIQYKGVSIIGFAARQNYVGIYPFSGHVISAIKELDKYDKTKSAVREKLDDLLPKELIQKIINFRLQQQI